MVSSVKRGTGSVVVLLGEAGVGKSRLAQLLASLGRDAGARVVVGRALPQLVASPLRPLEEVLLDLARDVPLPEDPALAPFLAVLGSLIPQWRPAGWHSPNESPLMTAEGVYRLLRAAAPPAGLLVILEDLHWADDASLAVLRFLADRIHTVAVGLLVTVRTGEGHDEAALSLEAAGAHIIRLGRLSLTESQDMARACLGDAAEAEVIERVAREAEGLPLLVEDLLSVGALGEVPHRFAAAVGSRLARMTPAERRVLSSAAVLGRRFDWDLLDAVSGLPTDVVAQALHRGGALQLIVTEGGAFQFRHALTRDVVLNEIDPAERRALSLAGSNAVQDDEMAARLLLDAGEPEVAARRLLGAGHRSLAAGMLPTAAAALRAASPLVAAESDLGIEIGCELARTLLLSGRALEAEEVATRWLGPAMRRQPASAVTLQLLLARAAVATARWDDASARLDHARRTAGDDLAVAAEIAVLDLQVELGAGTVLATEGERHARAAALTAREAGRPDLECDAQEALGLWARVRDFDAAAVALDLALELARRNDLPAQHLRVLNELGMVEMLRDARPDRLQQARAEALRIGALGEAASIGVNLAALMVMTSRYDEAIAIAGEVESLAAGLGILPLQAAAHLMQGFAYGHRGLRREMDRHLSAAESLAPDDGDLRTGAWAIGRAINALVDEDRVAARRALARARAEAPEQLIRVPNTFDGPELLLRGVAGEPILLEAEEAAARIVKGARYLALWHSSAVAVARGSEGHAARASEALGRALDAGSRYPLFSALAMRLVAEAALRDGWEAGILWMLADRLSNREIAERLYLSARTVEKHVAALFQKLPAEDRSALSELARSML
jgi:ATP/maltotriose-dependent transcriptional regulator MalT